MVRRPSYIFPSSFGTTHSNTPPNNPLFTPSSSFAHPSLRILRPSPPTLLSHATELPDAENFLITIEQTQNLKLTMGGDISKQSILTGSKVGGSQVAINALEKFKMLQKGNVEFAKGLNIQEENTELIRSEVPSLVFVN